jgi:hypothetical protein
MTKANPSKAPTPIIAKTERFIFTLFDVAALRRLVFNHSSEQCFNRSYPIMRNFGIKGITPLFGK